MIFKARTTDGGTEAPRLIQTITMKVDPWGYDDDDVNDEVIVTLSDDDDDDDDDVIVMLCDDDDDDVNDESVVKISDDEFVNMIKVVMVVLNSLRTEN